MSDGSEPFVHPSAVVDPGAQLGAGTRVWHFVHVMPGAKIGARCVIGQGCFVGGEVTIGDGCRVQNNVSIFDGVTLEDEVFVGPSAVFTNVNNPRAHISRRPAFDKTVIKKGASIGANATIVCGVTVGEHAFIGAGAVVRHDVAPHAIVVGVPAGWIGWMCRCGERLPHADGTGRMTCGSCALKYRTRDGGVVRDET
jgi:UDP-2-acetamido-3-amino-2,3-dideoxy-glucuronate N-acetyltransferase